MQKQLYVITQEKPDATVDFFDIYKFVPENLELLTEEQKLELCENNHNQFNLLGSDLTPIELLREGLADEAVMEYVNSHVDGTLRKTFYKTLKDHPLKVSSTELDLYKEHLAYNAEKGITMSAAFVDCDDNWNPL